MSFFKKLAEVASKGFEAGETALEERAENRHAANLFLKLGIAVYAEQRLGGSHAPVERILTALDGHAAEYGEVDLDDLEAAREVLGAEFLAELNDDDDAEAGEPAQVAAP
ncbi:hypothetical protein [Actinacidiphila yeochonensis]|uniref:hypothetical protein n=1 Tax=Actinacidiphila yeochonensis TaxID=89050 RepID=UPI0005676B32|nr:hypothetical protein [Actinacidiphila yeochonensis]